ncbi:MAG: hypothetical protein A3G66_03800 [Candidatus Levybacteria bacterium RIFCSPLOWO2_12_FULL_39_17]|nr:MAG: Cna B domain protein [Candidatus Levybacteria bacterium GW2011_GWA1_39_11]OGH47072.1 MAG: hypothetical protein A3G66_03800 [Candidatus Levybacteria bacterium RIFCSPLOWO2_12_FULL_39_17]
MKKMLNIKKIAIGLSAGAIMLAATVVQSFAVTCTPTGFFRDSINMTAAQINPAGTVSGDVDATGCNIGIYYDTSSGDVDGADIHGANYFGVVVNGDVNNPSVDVKNSEIHDIGETPLNGSQHGLAIYYRALSTGTVAGEISGNEVYTYQKNGITVNGEGANVNVENNTVTGEGRVDYIAQNGIQFGYGAVGNISGSTVTGHYWTGCSHQDAAKTGCTPWVSAGLLLYAVEAKNVKTSNNMLRNNQFNYLLLPSQSLGILP